MPQTMKFYRRDAKRVHQPLVVAPISARLYRLAIIGQYIECPVDHFHEWLDERKSLTADRDLAYGIWCFWYASSLPR